MTVGYAMTGPDVAFAEQRISPKGKRRLRSGGRLVRNIVAYVVGIIVIAPVLLLVLDSIKPESQVYTLPPSLVFKPTLANFRLNIDSGYVHYLINSVVIVLGSTCVAAILGVPAAFKLVVCGTKHNRDILFWFLATKFLPVVGVIVPLYVIYNRMHLLDTWVGLGFIYTAMALPLVVLIMRAYLADVPGELLDAAQVDGAGLLVGLARVIVPLAVPGIITACLLSFIFSWNEFFVALMLTTTKAATLPVFIASSQTTMGLGLGSLSAAAVLAASPVVLVGWVAQRNLASGLTLGAIK